jgi:hypothetical protein
MGKPDQMSPHRASVPPGTNVRKTGWDWTLAEREEGDKLDRAALKAAAAKEEALQASGLVADFGYYAPAVALKQAARTVI